MTGDKNDDGLDPWAPPLPGAFAKYTGDIRSRAIALLLDPGVSAEMLADALTGVHPISASTIRAWRRRYRNATVREAGLHE